MPTITTIFTHAVGEKAGVLGIDEDARLYWNGQVVVTEQKVKLSRGVNVAVMVGGWSTFITAVFTALLYFKP